MGYRRIAIRRQRSFTGNEPVGCQVALLMVASVVAIPATFGLSLLIIPAIGVILAGSKPKRTPADDDPATWSPEKREAWLDKQYWAALAADTRSAEERFEAEMARYTKN